MTFHGQCAIFKCNNAGVTHSLKYVHVMGPDGDINIIKSEKKATY